MIILATSCEIVETLRIARLIERHGEQFIQRVYTPREMRYCQMRKQATQWYAAYWAGKEAVLRALGTTWRRGIRWQDVELSATGPGQTNVILRGGVREWMQMRQVAEVVVSVSHCRTHAMAHAMALGDEPIIEGEEGE
jgi:holo-[acyl-carrier protein] synthase